MPYTSGIDRRVHTRNISLNSVQFCFDHDSPEKTLMGATVNVSDSGMCLVTSSELREGECIIIKNELSPLSRKAIVRWVRNFGQNLCKAGLIFPE